MLKFDPDFTSFVVIPESKGNQPLKRSNKYHQVNHAILFEGKQYKIDNLSLFMLRSPKESSINNLINKTIFRFCEDKETKLVALQLKSDRSKVLTLQEIFKQIIRKIQRIFIHITMEQLKK